MLSDHCGLSLLITLPDDVFAIISKSLLPRDICNLSLCCRSLTDIADSDKVWLSQCEVLGIIPPQDIIEWRKDVASYKSLCHFLVKVQPLMGIWVHQNPELGNVVYVMPGYVSVVGCRIIPQELGPLGIHDGPILWAPVFEIIGDGDGSLLFFLRGKEKEHDYIYPGLVKSIEKTCNVLLLEVEPRQHKNEGKLIHCKSVFQPSDIGLSRSIGRSENGVSRSQRIARPSASMASFSRLSFGDRRKLLENVTSQIRQKASDSGIGPLFPCSRDNGGKFWKDMVRLSERRSLILKMYKSGGDHMDWMAQSKLPLDSAQLKLRGIKNNLDPANAFRNSITGDDGLADCRRKKTFGGYIRDSLKHLLRKSTSINGSGRITKNSSSSSDNKHAQLHEFLRSGDKIELSLLASTIKLSSYRAWPNMHDSRFALYKMPLRVPKNGDDYAGLWGGTFGWPPGKPTEDKPGKALFFLLLSYEESQGQRLLIATKILEGTHYVLHPNGSAMFVVNVDEPSEEEFPWDTYPDSCLVNVEHAFTGEGIANGYGFRYPGSKPGSLFVIQDGLLAFIWTESRVVLTLQRLDLQELLRKGEQVQALPPIPNFSYLTKSYSNVFTGFPNTFNFVSSPRKTRL